MTKKNTSPFPVQIFPVIRDRISNNRPKFTARVIVPTDSRNAAKVTVYMHILAHAVSRDFSCSVSRGKTIFKTEFAGQDDNMNEIRFRLGYSEIFFSVALVKKRFWHEFRDA